MKLWNAFTDVMITLGILLGFLVVSTLLAYFLCYYTLNTLLIIGFGIFFHIILYIVRNERGHS